MAFCRFLLFFFAALALFTAVLIFAPGLPPYDVNFEAQLSEAHTSYEGNLAPNEALDHVQFLSDKADKSSLGIIIGAESFAAKDGFLYTGIQGGDILQLDLSNPQGHWRMVAHSGLDCHKFNQEQRCGRPLGLEFDANGLLLVADSYFGLLRINLQTKKSEVLVPPDLEIDGKRNKVTNSLAMTKDGKTIYYTVSSTNFYLEEGLLELLSAPSGRLMKYDVASNSSTVIMENLSFANGIVLSPDESYLLICESGTQIVWKYMLKGKRIGEKEVFAHLPGAVDNIKSNGKGGYLVGVIVPILPDKFYLLFAIRQYPMLCKFIVRMITLLKMLADGILQYVYPLEIVAEFRYRIGNMYHMGARWLPYYGLVVELDAQGTITKSYHSASKVGLICEGFVLDGFMYLGSPYNDYVARLPLK